MENELIKEIIETVVPTTTLAKDIRKGRWDADQILAIVEALEVTIAERREIGNKTGDDSYTSIKAVMTVLFYSKDRFSHHRETNEYMAVERLFGALMAALGN